MEKLTTIAIVRYEVVDNVPRYHVKDDKGDISVMDYTELCLLEVLHPEAKTYWLGENAYAQQR